MNNPNSFKALKIIHTAMLTGQILFAVVICYLMLSKILTAAAPQVDRYLQIAVLVVVAAGYYLGSFLFKKELVKIKEATSLSAQEKFTKYKTVSLIQWALLEVACLFCIISYFVTGNLANIGMAVLLIVLFALMAPNKTKIALQIGIDVEEL
jgi:hypothetical protein